MLKRKYKKIIVATLLTSSLISGFGGGAISSLMADITGTPNQAYAYSDSFNPNKYGMRTETGWVTSKVKCVDNIPENATLDQLKKMSIKISPETHPQLFRENAMAPGKQTFDYEKMNLTNEIYYWSNYDSKNKIQRDVFIKMISMTTTDTSPQVTKVYSNYIVVNGNTEGGKIPLNNCIVYNKTYYDALKAETSTTTPPKPIPTDKTYSASRLGGATRWETSTAIAKQVNGNKLDAVVLANAYNFPDALTGTTLAGNKKAPILIVGNNDRDIVTLNYIKNNLKSTGKVYVLGGSTAVSDGTINKVKSLGFKNIKRLGGSDRYATNMSIVNELNVSKGSSVIIANSMSYADSLSISGISGANNMPIFLVNGSLTSSVLNKIKSIAPKNIYIVGSTTVVNSNVEKQLKSYGNVVRLGGKNRFETSLKIANYFTKDTQTTALVSYGLNFPDALAGGALASKTASPILLVNGDVTAQKAFLDKSNITKLYVLGSTSAVSDSIVKQLTK